MSAPSWSELWDRFAFLVRADAGTAYRRWWWRWARWKIEHGRRKDYKRRIALNHPDPPRKYPKGVLEELLSAPTDAALGGFLGMRNAQQQQRLRNQQQQAEAQAFFNDPGGYLRGQIDLAQGRPPGAPNPLEALLKAQQEGETYTYWDPLQQKWITTKRSRPS